MALECRLVDCLAYADSPNYCPHDLVSFRLSNKLSVISFEEIHDSKYSGGSPDLEGDGAWERRPLGHRLRIWRRLPRVRGAGPEVRIFPARAQHDLGDLDCPDPVLLEWRGADSGYAAQCDIPRRGRTAGDRRGRIP